MGREVRMVPADWQHPKYTAENAPFERAIGRYIPMLEASHRKAVEQWEKHDLPEWLEGERLWRDEGKVKTYDGVETIAAVVERHRERHPERSLPDTPSYAWWAGDRPERPDETGYMPDWADDQRTHFMMYEDTSEGTPISPAFATPEELARWLADTGASSFADQTASYEAWLRVAKGGFAPSAVLSSAGFQSGVEALADAPIITKGSDRG